MIPLIVSLGYEVKQTNPTTGFKWRARPWALKFQFNIVKASQFPLNSSTQLIFFRLKFVEEIENLGGKTKISGP